MANFSIASTPILADPQRNYLFQVDFTRLPSGVQGDLTELTFRATSCSIPSRGNGVIEVPFYQMKSAYPGKPNFGDNKFTVTFNEYEDRVVTEFLYSWQERIFETKTSGASLFSDKQAMICPNVEVQLLKFNGGIISTDKKGTVQFKNVWVENVQEVALNWNEEGAVQITADFHFDYWCYKA